jgi:hypothetical protein
MRLEVHQQNREMILKHIRETMGFDSDKSLKLTAYPARGRHFMVHVTGTNRMLHCPMSKQWKLPAQKRVQFINALCGESLTLESGW